MYSPNNHILYKVLPPIFSVPTWYAIHNYYHIDNWLHSSCCTLHPGDYCVTAHLYFFIPSPSAPRGLLHSLGSCRTMSLLLLRHIMLKSLSGAMQLWACLEHTFPELWTAGFLSLLSPSELSPSCSAPLSQILPNSIVWLLWILQRTLYINLHFFLFIFSVSRTVPNV